jgi:hypothetical protein
MIVQGSLSYTTSGRKMFRPFSKRRRLPHNWKEYRPAASIPSVNWRDTSHYPSLELGAPNPEETAKKEHYVSTKHTIAPAYNKGAYQVISEENIQDIGR